MVEHRPTSIRRRNKHRCRFGWHLEHRHHHRLPPDTHRVYSFRNRSHCRNIGSPSNKAYHTVLHISLHEHTVYSIPVQNNHRDVHIRHHSHRLNTCLRCSRHNSSSGGHSPHQRYTTHHIRIRTGCPHIVCMHRCNPSQHCSTGDNCQNSYSVHSHKADMHWYRHSRCCFGTFFHRFPVCAQLHFVWRADLLLPLHRRGAARTEVHRTRAGAAKVSSSMRESVCVRA
mmetsp:Transcript_23911/g.59822  ORF Transcript_23911/g.59822 Transcript_23911/m.59822 type:complete len:227 (+) Transcript_23911:83-763(+)